MVEQAPVETPDRTELERLAAGVLMIGFPGQTVPDDTRTLIKRGIRNIIFFARNMGTAEEIRALTSELRSLIGEDALIAIDHEGGRVNRLPHVATRWPSPMAWAATGDTDLVRRASAASARELAALGINVNFAPVTDLLADHRNPVLGVRCFSDDPETAARFASAFVEGHRAAGVGTTAKHFPGHGHTPVDSHVDLPRIERDLDELRAEDMVPFVAALEAGADGVMVSHVWFPSLDEEPLPATVSPTIGALAREVLGPDGLIVTDCMEMGAIQEHMGTGPAVVQAVQSGADLVLVSHRAERQQEALDALIAAAQDGSLPRERLEEANRRVDALRRQLQREPDLRIEEGPELAREIAQRAVTLVRNEHGYLPLDLAPDEQLGVVTFDPGTPTGIEGRRVHPLPDLADAARKQHAAVVEVVADRDTDPSAVMDRLYDVNTVLVGTSFATGRPWQGEVVRALLESGKRVVVLALADPFDLLSFPQAPAYVATYGQEPDMLEAAMNVLFDKAQAVGRLPVEIPGLYRRGWHLES